MNIHKEIVMRSNHLAWMDKVFLPVIEILTEEDIPIKDMNASIYGTSLVLEDGVKLSVKAKKAIENAIGEIKITTEVKDGFAEISIQQKGDNSYTRTIKIDNGKGTCKTHRRSRIVHIEAHDEEQVYYTVANGCSGLELET
jgi:hypothetical protein